jgi:hypothetical protein
VNGTPDYSALLGVIWGNWFDGATSNVLANASGVVTGQNPPYSLSDFFSFYPNFGGTVISPTGDITEGTAVVANITTTGLIAGTAFAGSGIPDGAVILSIGSGTITLTKNATLTATGVQFTSWPAPKLPTPVIMAYIFLATSSVLQAKYQEMWWFMMANYIGHYCTLWLQTQATTPNANAQQIVSAGLAIGIKTAKTAGNVSVGIQPLQDLEGWASYQLTTYGQEFATIAKSLGSLPMFLY